MPEEPIIDTVLDERGVYVPVPEVKKKPNKKKITKNIVKYRIRKKPSELTEIIQGIEEGMYIINSIGRFFK